MKAIVLTFDRNEIFTEHMIAKYMELWPDNPFHFIIPYQNRNLIKAKNKIFVRSPVKIRATVLHLLDQLPDDEWIYWCIDDCYPVYLDVAGIQKIYSLITDNQDTDASGINFCITNSKERALRKKRIKNGDIVGEIGGFKTIEMFDYNQIWLHQFIRVGALRYLFEKIPEPKNGAKEMDDTKTSVQKPKKHKLLMLDRDLARFGESTARGVITENCLKSINSMAMNLDPNIHKSGIARSRIRGKISWIKIIVNKFRNVFVSNTNEVR